MHRIINFLTNRTVLGIIGLLAVSGFILLLARMLQVAFAWALLLILIIVLTWTTVWWVRRRRARQGALAMDSIMQQESERGVAQASPAKKAETEALRKRLSDAIATLKKSKLGEASGAGALYELPWYVVIGNPAAGKSSAIVNSGLHFPFAEKGEVVIQGIGGTRNCDWFFTTEGILLDTAGRYAVHEEDRGEWLGFLNLLKKHRPKAPVNGILVVASVPELTRNRPDFVINLAKQIRERLQEITSQLEIFAPVYVMFTKIDLIEGFVEFFGGSDLAERGRVWGATLPYDAEGKVDPVVSFDEQFDQLFDGLKESSISQMALYRGDALGPGVLTFPVEFAGLRPALRAFVATLFEDNPFQFRPIFRGFYFTSALQEGQATSVSSDRIAGRFDLKPPAKTRTNAPSLGGFFLRDLFSKVVFADRNLVRQYIGRTKRRARLALFACCVLVIALALGGMTWSFVGNQNLIDNVQADLDKAIKLQEGRIDLASRMEALEILQDRIAQLRRYRDDTPLALSFGLYRGDQIEAALRREYYAGIQEVMLKPVAASLESLLTEANRRSTELKSANTTPIVAALTGENAAGDSAATREPAGYRTASPVDAQDVYNALKTYLMLADHEHTEVGHLNDQLTRHWRAWLEANRGAMPREQMIRSAERLMSFFLSLADDPAFPTMETKLLLVDKARENLRRVTQGMPARERVYAEIKARASTRFPPMTVARIIGEEGKDMLAGSHAISGTFTLDAWNQYVEPAIKDAANKTLQSNDWVLKTVSHDDLSLEGSPEQINKALVATYKNEYVLEWQKFLQGVSVNEFNGFDDAVKRINLLGDPSRSPLDKVLQTAYAQTAWDNPSFLDQQLRSGLQQGFVAWFRETILRQAPAQVNININANAATKQEIQLGPIGREFAGLGSLMAVRGSDGASLYKGYLDALAKTKNRFNQMKNGGDPGPACRQLVQQTLEGNGSELADALKYVDEQMLNGMPDASRQTLRPLLVRPLMMAYAVILKPTEAELNRTWNAQAYEPFMRGLVAKYPFTANAGVEATAMEIAQLFGPEGAIAKYVQNTMGSLVIRRGDTLTARTWADMGIQLQPDFANQFSRYVAPPTGAADTGGGGAGGGQTVFQIRPLPVAGLSEYTIDIDGQTLRYRMGTGEWTDFVWPGGKGAPGAKIVAVTYDGRPMEIVNHPGRFGLEKMISSASRSKLPDGGFRLTWENGTRSVAVELRIVSSPQANAPAQEGGGSGPARQTLLGIKLPQTVVGGV